MDYLSSSFGRYENSTISIVCNDAMLRIMVQDVCAIIGSATIAFESIDAVLSSRDDLGAPAPATLLIDLRTEMDGTDSELSDLGLYCQTYGTRLVIVTNLERIDTLYGMVPEGLTEFVIGEDPGALLFALTVASRTPKMATLFEHAKDESSPALSKISAELAEFARALSRIAQAEEEGEIGADYLADKPRGYAPPSGAVAMPFTSGAASNAEAGLDPNMIRNLIRVRRLRNRYFDDEMFADPAWDILLDLMAARLEGTKVSVSSLCIAASVPATTALRWIKSMTDDGYLERRADPTDARRVYIHLSDTTAQKMAQYLRARAEVSVI